MIIIKMLGTTIGIKLTLLFAILVHMQILGMIRTPWTNYMPFVHCDNQSLPIWFSLMQVSIYEGSWMTLWNKSLN